MKVRRYRPKHNLETASFRVNMENEQEVKEAEKIHEELLDDGYRVLSSNGLFLVDWVYARDIDGGHTAQVLTIDGKPCFSRPRS